MRAAVRALVFSWSAACLPAAQPVPPALTEVSWEASRPRGQPLGRLAPVVSICRYQGRAGEKRPGHRAGQGREECSQASRKLPAAFRQEPRGPWLWTADSGGVGGEECRAGGRAEQDSGNEGAFVLHAPRVPCPAGLVTDEGRKRLSPLCGSHASARRSAHHPARLPGPGAVPRLQGHHGIEARPCGHQPPAPRHRTVGEGPSGGAAGRAPTPAPLPPAPGSAVPARVRPCARHTRSSP